MRRKATLTPKTTPEEKKVWVYINTNNIKINEGGGNLPVVTVDYPEDVMNGQKDAWDVRIGDNTRIVYNPDGNYRGARVYIETTEEVVYNENPA